MHIFSRTLAEQETGTISISSILRIKSKKTLSNPRVYLGERKPTAPKPTYHALISDEAVRYAMNTNGCP